MPKNYVVWFKDVDKDDIGSVGGKGANLGEMTQAGFPVPPGFIVTVAAYEKFLAENKLRDKIHGFLAGLDVAKSKDLEKAAQDIQKLIIRSVFPRDIAL